MPKKATKKQLPSKAQEERPIVVCHTPRLMVCRGGILLNPYSKNKNLERPS